MRNLNNDWDCDGDNYDYGPNELAELSINNPRLYKDIVSSNLDEGDSISNWQQRNLDWAQDCLAQQRSNRRRY